VFGNMANTSHDTFAINKDIYRNEILMDRDIALSQKGAFNNMLTKHNCVSIRHKKRFGHESGKEIQMHYTHYLHSNILGSEFH
jgi:hypothetical protein